MTTHWTDERRDRSTIFISAARLAALAALAALGGCGQPDNPEGAPVTVAALDQGTLENVLLNEREMKAGGYELEGRAWLRRDVGLSIYVDQAGTRVILETMRAGALTDEGDHQPREGEPFWSYVVRLGGASPREIADLPASAGPNVLLFDPGAAAAAPGDVTGVQGAVVGQNDRCDAAWFNARCGESAGFRTYDQRSFISYTWSLLDRTATAVQPPAANRNVVGVNAVGCADRGTVEFKVTNSNPRFGSAPASVVVTLNEGFAQRNWMVGGWREREFCADRFLGICVDYDYRHQIASFDTSVTVSPRSVGAEAHFCGRLTKHDDDVSPVPCREISVCPIVCEPGNVRPDC